MTQERIASKAVIEVTVNDKTGEFTIKRTVIDSFTPAKKQGDYDSRELIVEDTHTTHKLSEVMRHTLKALFYLDFKFGLFSSKRI